MTGWYVGGLLIIALGMVAWRSLAARPQVRAWVRARLTPSGYLGLHLTLGLGASAACLALFGDLAEDVFSNDPIVRLDHEVATTLHAHATPLRTNAMLLVTALGAPAVIVLGVVVTLLYVWRRHWLHVAVWVVALGGGEALNALLKGIFLRPRPVFEHPLLVESYYSFPSGHAMGALIAYGLLAYFTWLALPRGRRRALVIGGAALLVVAIGFSRLYLGVHYLSDVLAGFAAGGLWLSCCITAMELVRHGEIGGRWQQHLRHELPARGAAR